jgi:hypothetical protein
LARTDEPIGLRTPPAPHGAHPSRLGRAQELQLEAWLIGRPLSTADAPHQAIGKAVGLAVFSSDALSSTAYATQEILIILAMAGTAALGWVLPVSAAIVGLLVILTISYEQTIHAYPSGGGAYIVARDNLGDSRPRSRAAALLLDYILTVSVSISSGVAQLTSAFPALYAHRVAVAVLLVGFVMFVNLRGRQGVGTGLRAADLLLRGDDVPTVGRRPLRSWSGTLHPLADAPPLEIETTRGSGCSCCCTPSRAARPPSPASRPSPTASRVQAAAQPQRGDHPDVDGGHPRDALSRPSAICRPDRRRALRARDRDLAARSGGLRRPRHPVSRRDRGDDADPGDGREHGVRRLPAPGRAASGATASCPASSPTAAAASSIREASCCWR